jgi:hypothetical protein
MARGRDVGRVGVGRVGVGRVGVGRVGVGRVGVRCWPRRCSVLAAAAETVAETPLCNVLPIYLAIYRVYQRWFVGGDGSARAPCRHCRRW